MSRRGKSGLPFPPPSCSLSPRREGEWVWGQDPEMLLAGTWRGV